MGSLLLRFLFAQLCGLTTVALASPFANVTSSASTSSLSNEALSYCENYLDTDNVNQGPWFEGMNQSLSAYCLTSWCNSLSQDTPYTTTETAPVYPPKYQPPGTTTTTLPVSTTLTITSYTSLPSFVSPCCGECPITVVSGAEVLYWPTPAPQPPVESVVDANGFTFVSPSVYVVFSSLAANDNCGVVGSLQPNFTTSFAPDELSTFVGGIQAATDYTLQFNYADLSDCFTSFVTSTYSKAFDTTEVFTTVIPDWETPAVYNLWTSKSSRCYPLVVVEPFITDLDPAWSSCTAGTNYVGAGVPVIHATPRPLVGVDGLFESITTASSSIAMTPASPSPAPASIATSTTTAEASVATSAEVSAESSSETSVASSAEASVTTSAGAYSTTSAGSCSG